MRLTPHEVRQVLVGPALTLITPFSGPDLKIDIDGLRANTRWVIQHGFATGAGTLIVGGSNGEGYALSDEERMWVIRAVVEEANGEVPVIAGINHTSTQAAVALAQYAEEVGADGVMSTPPFYLEPSQADMLRYYSKLADSIRIGIMVYDIAEVAKAGIELETLKQLSQFENVVALKAAGPNLADYFDKIQRLGDRLAIITNDANPLIVVTGYFWGASGHISAQGNWNPTAELALARAALSDDWGVSRSIARTRLKPFVDFSNRMIQRDGANAWVSLLQAATAAVGNAGGTPRPPCWQLPDADLQELRQILSESEVTAGDDHGA